LTPIRTDVRIGVKAGLTVLELIGRVPTNDRPQAGKGTARGRQPGQASERQIRRGDGREGSSHRRGGGGQGPELDSRSNRDIPGTSPADHRFARAEKVTGLLPCQQVPAWLGDRPRSSQRVFIVESRGMTGSVAETFMAHHLPSQCGWRYIDRLNTGDSSSSGGRSSLPGISRSLRWTSSPIRRAVQ
jgi:hypothetical protein